MESLRRLARRIPGRKPLVLHPLLFALFPVLALYSVNVREVAPSEVLLPAAVAMGAALALLAISGLLARNVRKAGVFVSIFVALFFSYGHAANLIDGWSGAHVFLMSMSGVLLVLGILFLARTRRDLGNMTRALNIVAVVLVAVPAANIAFREIDAALRDVETRQAETASLDWSGEGELPDIYYLVFDRYAGDQTLRDVFNFDNSEFIDYLTDKGFYVASESVSNYLKTRSSLASSLNMKYLNYLTDELGDDFEDVGPMYKLLEDYEVWRMLKSQGYEFVHFGSWWWPTATNPNADVVINYGDVHGLDRSIEIPMPYTMPEFYRMTEFSRLVFRTTLMYHAYVKLNFMEDDLRMQWRRVLYKLDKLAEMPEREGPTFVFAHMLLPHPAFVFDCDGSFVSKEEAEARGRSVNYVNQLTFANNQLRELIDEILAKSEAPPIIILQSDEGPFPPGTDYPWFAWEEATDEQLREKTRIMNAYYFPGVDTSVLYPSITPVNSFRVMFNLYFGADFELLPDRSFSFSKGRPYDFFEVTDIVKYN